MRVKAGVRARRQDTPSTVPVDAAMLFLRIAPVVLAALLLGAHFYRAGALWLAALAVGALALLFVRRPWAARALQAGLVAGAIEWMRTLASFAAERVSFGQPYARMALILGAVALVTALAALVFETRAMRSRHGLRRRSRAVA
jgi:hypothetical protein